MTLRFIAVCIAILLAPAIGNAQSSKWRTTKRIFAITGCAAQAIDLYTTHRALRRPGFAEGNPLLRRSDGGLRWSVAVPTKAVACAMPLIFENRKLDRFWTIYGIGQTGVYSGIAFRNATR